MLLAGCVRARAYFPRDVFFTFAAFFAAFAGRSSVDPAASALSFCFLVAMSTIVSAGEPALGESTIVSGEKDGGRFRCVTDQQKPCVCRAFQRLRD